MNIPDIELKINRFIEKKTLVYSTKTFITVSVVNENVFDAPPNLNKLTEFA